MSETVTQDSNGNIFLPCYVCGGTEADFDGYCQQCELPMDVKSGASIRKGEGCANIFALIR